MNYRNLVELKSKVEVRSQIITTTDVRPENVDPMTYGNHCSYVLREGDTAIRVWGFDDPDGRYRFSCNYEEHVVR